MGKRTHSLKTICDNAAEHVTAVLPYCRALLCAPLSSSRVIVFTWDTEGGNFKPLRVFRVDLNKVKRLREVLPDPSCRKAWNLYKLYAEWCIKRIAVRDTDKVEYKEHRNV